MKLKEIAIGYIEIPLVTPFKTALRTVNSVNDLIVKVTAEDGTEGYGEAPPTAVITGDTKEFHRGSHPLLYCPFHYRDGSGRPSVYYGKNGKVSCQKYYCKGSCGHCAL